MSLLDVKTSAHDLQQYVLNSIGKKKHAITNFTSVFSFLNFLIFIKCQKIQKAFHKYSEPSSSPYSKGYNIAFISQTCVGCF